MLKIFRLPLYYPRAVRSLQILFTLLQFITVNWLSSNYFTLWMVPKRYKRDGRVQPLPERLRTVIEELGPTFIKFGQILADRPDVISESLRVELKKLQDKAIPFDDAFAIRLMETELGGPITDFFQEFSTRPIAAASIGQVYKGVLKDGSVVVVKIQRPNIESKIKLDLHILQYLAQQLVKEFPGLQVVDIVGVVEEFGNTLLQELNYMNEASNAVRFASIFRDVSYCKIPKVHLNLSTPRMLVLEDVSGVCPDSPERLREAGLEPDIIARHGVHIFMEMLFKHGFFHADPHPGNLFVLPGNVVAMVDFGMVGTLKPTHMQFLAGFTLGLANKNAEVLTDALLVMCEKKFFDDKQNLQFAIHEMLLRHGSLRYQNVSFSQVLNECVQIILTYKLRLPGSIYLLLKALATIEKFGHRLDAKIHLEELVRPYAESLVRANFSPEKFAHGAYDIIKDWGALIRDFPGEINEILYKLKQGKVTIDIQLNDKQIFTSVAKQSPATLSLTLLLGAMLAASVVINVWGTRTPGTEFLFGLSVFFSVWLLLRLFFKTR